MFEIGTQVDVWGVGRGIVVNPSVEINGRDDALLAVELQDGFWGWRGQSNRAEGEQAFSYVSLLLVHPNAVGIV